MEDKLSIKINIADRFYPLKIKREDEEKIRKAAKIINDKIGAYKQHFRDKDAYDFLAMTALQLATELQETDNSEQIMSMENEIRQLNSDIDEYLKNYKEKSDTI